MEVFWFVLATASIGLLTFYYLFIKKNRFQKCGIPGPHPFVNVIRTIQLLCKRLALTDNIMEMYNINKDAKYIGLYDINYPVIMLNDIELIKNVTVKNFDNFTDHRPFLDPDSDPLFGNNLFSLLGDKWREVRTLLSPAFTSSKMKTMFVLMTQCADTFVNNLIYQSTKKSMDIDAKDILGRYTSDTIATCAFGVSVDSMRNPNNQFYVLGKKATDIGGFFSIIKFLIFQLMPRVGKLFGLKLIAKDVEDFFYQLIRETIATRDEKGIVRPDMLQLMMEARGNKPENKSPELSIQQMTSQAFIFFFAGFDTTSTAMCFIIHEIVAHPEVRERLQCEIDEVFDESNGEPTYDAVQSMEYLDAVITETMRMYPSQIMLDRMCTRSFELPPALPNAKPFVVQPGDNVWIPVWPIQRDPEYYPDPDKFQPERFMKDSKHDVNPPPYMPFGIGPRMCIGNRFAILEMKVLVLHLFHKCNVKISKKMIMPLTIARDNFNLMAEGGFWLEIEPRKKTD